MTLVDAFVETAKQPDTYIIPFVWVGVVAIISLLTGLPFPLDAAFIGAICGTFIGGIVVRRLN